MTAGRRRSRVGMGRPGGLPHFMGSCERRAGSSRSRSRTRIHYRSRNRKESLTIGLLLLAAAATIVAALGGGAGRSLRAPSSPSRYSNGAVCLGSKSARAPDRPPLGERGESGERRTAAR